jgi:hypothetical protein
MHATADELVILMRDDAGTDVRSTNWDETAANFNRFAPGTDLGPFSPSCPVATSPCRTGVM